MTRVNRSEWWRNCAGAAVLPFALWSATATAQSAGGGFPERIDGDLGGMVYAASATIRGDSATVLPLPYAYFDYQRFYARIDTFGIKGCRLGYGHVELAGRIAVDGFKTDTAALRGLSERKNSIPLGLGTYQLTPIGAFFAYAFHDAGESRGNLYELSYAARLQGKTLTFYPQLGVDYLSQAYVAYYDGVAPVEAASSGYRAYRPGGGAMPFAAMMAEVSLGGDWVGTLRLRRDWLPAAVYDSPLVKDKTRDSAFVAVSYRFK